MRKILLVTAHLVRQTALRWSYLIVLFSPLIWLLITGGYTLFVGWAISLKPATASAPAPQAVITNTVAFDEAVGYVDSAKLITYLPADIPAGKFVAYPDEASASAAVRSGKIVGYYLIPPDYVAKGAVTYYSPLNTQFAGTDEALKKLLMLNLAGSEKEAIARRILQPMTVVEKELASAGEKPDSHYSTREIAIGLGIGGLFFFIVQMTGGRILGYMVMEKTNRLIDILMGSVSPGQLLAGKFVGAAIISLLEIAAWLGWTWLFTGESGPLQTMPPRTVALALLIVVGGYFAYAAIFTVFSTLIRSYRESTVITGMISLMALAPLFWLFAVLAAPDGGTAIALSLIPLSSPIMMTLRLLVSDVPGWQVGVSAALLLGWAALMIGLAARLFRTQMLAGRSLGEMFNSWVKSFASA